MSRFTLGFAEIRSAKKVPLIGVRLSNFISCLSRDLSIYLMRFDKNWLIDNIVFPT